MCILQSEHTIVKWPPDYLFTIILYVFWCFLFIALHHLFCFYLSVITCDTAYLLCDGVQSCNLLCVLYYVLCMINVVMVWDGCLVVAGGRMFWCSVAHSFISTSYFLQSLKPCFKHSIDDILLNTDRLTNATTIWLCFSKITNMAVLQMFSDLPLLF